MRIPLGLYCGLVLVLMVQGCASSIGGTSAPNIDNVTIEDLTPGTGPAAISLTPINTAQPAIVTILVVKYVGKLSTTDSRNGEVFENSADRGAPVPILLGDVSRLNAVQQAFIAKNNVTTTVFFSSIRGIQIGLQGMQAGGIRRITVPPSLATPISNFGASFSQAIVPSTATLVYTVELVSLIQVPLN